MNHFNQSDAVRTAAIRLLRIILLTTTALALVAYATASEDAIEEPYVSKYWLVGLISNDSEDTRFKDTDCNSTSPAALYGCGQGNDGHPLSTAGSFGNFNGLEIGVGFDRGSNFRVEATLQHYDKFDFSGDANFVQTGDRQKVSASLSLTSAMVAGYFDFPQSGGLFSEKFTPYIGAGFGLGQIDVDETRMRFPRTSTLVPGNSQINPISMAAVGISKKLSDSSVLDLSLRYSDFGVVKTGSGQGEIIFHESGNTTQLNLAETRGRLTSTGIRLSFRIDM